MLAVSLARQSEARDEDESLSLAYQHRRNTDEAVKRGDEIVKAFSDLDVSGDRASGKKRIGLHEMVAYLKQHPEIRKVYVYNISRLARDALFILELVRDLRALKPSVELVSSSEQIEDPTILTVISAFAERERVVLSNNIAYAVRESARRGRMILQPPFGYRLTSGDVSIVESEAAVVRRIFAAYCSGHTTGEILDALHRDGVPTPTGLPTWQRSTLTKLLRNRSYNGQIAIRETRDPIGRVRPALITEGAHEGIVDRETWNTAQRLLDAERPARRVTRYPAPWLAGAIVCAVCGQRVYVELLRSKPERLQPYWVARCASHRRAANTRGSSVCAGQSLSTYAAIERSARIALADDLAAAIDPAKAIQRAIASTGRDRHRRGDELRRVIVETEERLARVYLAYEAGDIPLELHRQRRAALERQRDEATAELASVPVLPELVRFAAARTAIADHAGLVPAMTDDDLRALVTELGAVASVDLKTKSCRWVYADPYCWLLGSDAR